MWRIAMALSLCVACLAGAQQISPKDQEQLIIRHLLQAQVDAWNAHDLDGFMNGYWHSPELMFFSGKTVTQGWQTTLERYRKKYQAEGTDKDMGKLDFYDLRVDVVDPHVAFVSGHWHLLKKSGKEDGGLFTLVLKKFPEGWRIVQDHTS